MSSRFIHVVIYDRISFNLRLKDILLNMLHIQNILYSSAIGHLGCIHILHIVNNVLIKIVVEINLLNLHFFWIFTQKWDCSVYISFKFLKNLHTVFYNDCQSVQSLSRVQLFANPWTAAHQASLSITNSQSLLEFMSVKSVMPSNNLILSHPLLFLPSIFPSIRFFSIKSVLC